jgi:hypothetical protein
MSDTKEPFGADLDAIVWRALRANFSSEELEGAELWFEEFGLHYEAESSFESVLGINLYHPQGEDWPRPTATAAAHSQLVYEASARGDTRLPMLYHTSMKPPVRLKATRKAA